MSSLHDVIIKAKSEQFGCAFKCDEAMCCHTSFKIGGSVKIMFFPDNADKLEAVIKLLYENEIKPLILGRGTNLLVDDKHLDLAVINTLFLSDIPAEVAKLPDNVIFAGAGSGLNTLAMAALERGLSGLEFAHGIPGTLGGAIKMNAGAYDGEMKDIVLKTVAIDNTGKKYTIERNEHIFGYRHSYFSDNSDIILYSYLELKKADKRDIKMKMDDFSKRRTSSQPLDMPSAGSIFKRPKKGYAADLIEKADLKGYTVGGAQISKKHAGFIVNLGNASFNDVRSVINHTQEEVLKLFNVELEPEIKFVM